MHIHNIIISDFTINNNSRHFPCQKAFLNSRLRSHILRGYFVNGKRKYVNCTDRLCPLSINTLLAGIFPTFLPGFIC